MNYRTLADMSKLIRENLHRIPRVDVVVGIPRSGMIAASMIATLTNQSLTGTDNLNPAATRILLVDDSISGGQTMQRALKNLAGIKITTLAVFRKPWSPPVDISFETVDNPRLFEWNWYRTYHIKNAVLDIDGVVSTPTTPGHRHIGLPLYLPAYQPLALATHRHEEERTVTESWLQSYGVKYGQLFMKDGFGESSKLRAIRETKPTWFVESSLEQSEFIRYKTGLPVLCTDANRMIG